MPSEMEAISKGGEWAALVLGKVARGSLVEPMQTLSSAKH